MPAPRLLTRVAVAFAVLTAAVAPAAAAAADAPRMRFGIYPGGGAGAFAAGAGQARSEDPGRRLAALHQLRGSGRAFVLHTYASWDGAGDAGLLASLRAETSSYTAAGFDVEPTIRYRPRLPGEGSPGAFADSVARAVAILARDPHVVSVQVTNEANVPNAPEAADGAYSGAARALVAGVVAADRAARAAGRSDLRVGFNWAAGAPATADDAFWKVLRKGGRSFREALDWVGLDIYPGTWSAPRAVTASAVRRAVRRTVRTLRRERLRRARIPPRVTLQVSENGYPTGAGRSEADQVMVMRASIEELHALRRRYRISDYRWFDLRDARSGTGLMENEYGVLREDYSPKAGFAVLGSLVAAYGASR